MELDAGDRPDKGKLIQRVAHRNAAGTKRERLANSLRHFAQPETRIRSRAAAEPLRHHHHEASGEMDGFSGAADQHSADPRTMGRQTFATVIDRRYSKNRCNLNSLLMPSSHPIRSGNRAPSASLAD